VKAADLISPRGKPQSLRRIFEWWFSTFCASYEGYRVGELVKTELRETHRHTG
jgi:hypothetical protein